MPSVPWMKPALYGTLNIASATGIVFANKAVLSVYGFEFATALTLLHTLTTVLGMMLFCQLGMFTPKQVPALQVRQAILLTYANLHDSTLYIDPCWKVVSVCVSTLVCYLDVCAKDDKFAFLDTMIVTDRWLHWQQHMLVMLF